MESRSTRHLVLVGGGHAHVVVLRALAMRPEPRLRLTLVSPRSHATYSGMVPGVLAGQYRRAEAEIDLRALAARAGAAFLPDRAETIDAAQRMVELAERPPLAYDLLSLDVGSEPSGLDRCDPLAPVLPVRPIESAIDGIEAALSAAPPGGHRAVVIGAGAAGVELALALATRLRRAGAGSVTLVGEAAHPVLDRHPRTVRLVECALAGARVEFMGGTPVERVRVDGVLLVGGHLLPATLAVWAAGASGPEMFRRSALPIDERGFLCVGDDLRCGEQPEIFAAGDCAVLASHPHLPRAGVYAVRQGPVLAHNLRLAARGVSRLAVFRPQPRFLSLLNTGDGEAILSYGALACRGRSAWRLKDRIDRAFVTPPCTRLRR